MEVEASLGSRSSSLANGKPRRMHSCTRCPNFPLSPHSACQVELERSPAYSHIHVNTPHHSPSFSSVRKGEGLWLVTRSGAARTAMRARSFIPALLGGCVCVCVCVCVLSLSFPSRSLQRTVKVFLFRPRVRYGGLPRGTERARKRPATLRGNAARCIHPHRGLGGMPGLGRCPRTPPQRSAAFQSQQSKRFLSF